MEVSELDIIMWMHTTEKPFFFFNMLSDHLIGTPAIDNVLSSCDLLVLREDLGFLVLWR